MDPAGDWRTLEGMQEIKVAISPAAGLKLGPIPVSDTLHSPAMAPAADRPRTYLAGMGFRTLERHVLPAITGDIDAPPEETDV